MKNGQNFTDCWLSKSQFCLGVLAFKKKCTIVKCTENCNTVITFSPVPLVEDTDKWFIQHPFQLPSLLSQLCNTRWRGKTTFAMFPLGWHVIWISQTDSTKWTLRMKTRNIKYQLHERMALWESMVAKHLVFFRSCSSFWHLDLNVHHMCPDA